LRKGISAERLAASLLESLGYEILEKRKTIEIEGVEAAEVDIIAKSSSGEIYAVEVKAGRASVTDVRQAYTNAQILGMKPLLICKGFVDKAAEATVKRLGVKYILLPEFFLVSPEDISRIVSESITDVLLAFESINISNINPDDVKILRALAFSNSINEALHRTGLRRRKFNRKLEVLRRKGVFPLKIYSFPYLKLQSLYVLRRLEEERLLRDLNEKLSSLSEGILKARRKMARLESFKAVVFDVDGVLTEVDSIWQYIHEKLGTMDKALENKRKFERGEISYEEWAYLDVALWKGISRRKLEEILSGVKLRRGSKTLIKRLRRMGLEVIAISAGLDIVAQKICSELGITHFVSNTLVIDDDVVTGEVRVKVGYRNKDEVLRKICSKLGISTQECIAVGDSEVDVPMFKVSGLSILFNPKSTDIIKYADVVVYSKSIKIIADIIEGIIGSLNK